MEADRLIFKYSDDFVIDTDKEPFRREGFRVGIYGAPGSTKSYTAAAFIVEQFLQQGGTIVVFQPRAEWHTLKDKFPDVQVIGGPYNQDVPFSASHPKLYADAVVDQGISMIFYTPDVDDEEKLINFVNRFLDYVMKLQEVRHRPLLILLEEAHEYAPRTPSGHVAPAWVFNRMVKRCKDLWTGGRKLNIVPLAITQRPQELHFAIRQLCNLSLYGQFSPQDLAYIDKECLSHYRKEGLDVKAGPLKDLDAGNFLIIHHGEAGYNQRTVERLTPHGADTPSLEYVPESSEKVKTAVSDLGAKLKELLEKQAQEESELQKANRKVRELEQEVADLQSKVKLAGDLRDLLNRSDAKIDVSAVEAKFKEQYENLKADALRQAEEFDSVLKQRDELQGKVEILEEELGRLKPVEEALESIAASIVDEALQDLESKWATRITAQVTENLERKFRDRAGKQVTVVQPSSNFAPRLDKGPYAEWLKRLPKPYAKTFELLLNHPQGLTLDQLGILTGKKKVSLQSHDLPTLKKAGLITTSGNIVKVKTF